MKKKGKQQKPTILPAINMYRPKTHTKTQTKKKDFSSIECKCAEIDPYFHVQKYLKDMESNKGKRIEVFVTGSGANAHFICNTWQQCLLIVAQMVARKEPTI